MSHITGLFTIGRDAELRSTQSGTSVASLSLAFNYGMKGQDGRKPSQWVEASLWGKQAEALSQYLLKGKQVYCVLGDPHIEAYTARDGSQGSKLVARVIDIELARGGEGQQQSQPAAQRPAQRTQPNAYQQAREQAPKQGAGFDDVDSDIPF